MDKQDAFWNGFVSNTVVGTGNNLLLFQSKEHIYTYRCYIKPLYTDVDVWKFWYGNTVDSTFHEGGIAYANRSGGKWEIISAFVGVSHIPDGTVLEEVPITFCGCVSKTVLPDETFWSDAVRLTVLEGQYLVFTWRIQAETDKEAIPYSPDSQIPCYCAQDDGDLVFTLDCIKPNLFASKREGVKRLGFLGDSITQGCGTINNTYEFWAARIGTFVKETYSTWNLGLGYARARDAASKGAWYRKACLCDEIVLCLGINEVLNDMDSAEEIVSNIQAIVSGLKENNPAATVILFTLPPVNDTQYRVDVWRSVNNSLRKGKVCGIDALFDIAAILGYAGGVDYRCICGDVHPDGEGGALVANAFMRWLENKEWIV